MKKTQFLGVYSANLEIPIKKQDLTKTQYWFVWLLESENLFIVLNMDALQESPAFFLTHYQFSLHFIQENSIEISEPPCPPLHEVQFYDSATKEAPVNPIQETKQGANWKNHKHVQEKQSNNSSNIAYIAPQKQDVVSNNVSSQTLNRQQNNLELERQNKLARRLEGEILQTLAEIIHLWKNEEKESAIKRVDLLLARNDTFITAHKHTFTKCAIQLRKLQEWDLALKFALRCVEISPEDSHVYFNVARIYFEGKSFKQALKYIQQALALEPDMEAAQRLNTAIKSALSK